MSSSAWAPIMPSFHPDRVGVAVAEKEQCGAELVLLGSWQGQDRVAVLEQQQRGVAPPIHALLGLGDSAFKGRWLNVPGHNGQTAASRRRPARAGSLRFVLPSEVIIVAVASVVVVGAFAPASLRRSCLNPGEKPGLLAINGRTAYIALAASRRGVLVGLRHPEHKHVPLRHAGQLVARWKSDGVSCDPLLPLGRVAMRNNTAALLVNTSLSRVGIAMTPKIPSLSPTPSGR